MRLVLQVHWTLPATSVQHGPDLGFVPQAQFLFAKNSSRVWAEALNDFTQWYGRQRSQELPKEAKGEKDAEKDQEPKLEAELCVARSGVVMCSMAVGQGMWARPPASPPWELVLQPRG